MKKSVGKTFAFVVVFALMAAPSLSSSSGDAKKGQEIFESLTCVECHKGGGNSVHPSRPLKGESFLKRYPNDDKIEKTIRKGVPGASMPGFGKDIINDEQMKDLIAYLRSLTPASASPSKTAVRSSSANKTGKN
jgi:mono/diheme cytochrome c family protein